MSELAPLRDAVESLTDDAQPPDFTELQARAARRARRRTSGMAVGAAGLLALVTLLGPRLDDQRRDVPAGPPSSEADRTIAKGDLVAWAGDGSGAVLTVWSTCGSADRACSTAWRFAPAGGRAFTGVLDSPRAYPQVVPVSGGFVLQPHGAKPGVMVFPDHSIVDLTRDCDGWTTWPRAREAQRYVLVDSLMAPNLVDTEGRTTCDTTGFEDARTLVHGTVDDEGTVWGLAGDGVDGPRRGKPAVARYDGTDWTYRDLAKDADPGSSLIDVEGATTVVAAVSGDGTVLGLVVSTDGGATWTDVPMPDAVGIESLALADPSTLFLVDREHTLWRSTDLRGFQRVTLDHPVSGLQPVGGSLLARVVGTEDLLRITPDGVAAPVG